MAKVIMICGKICSGKTFYYHSILKSDNTVLLSCDELMTALFHHNEGENFDNIAFDAKRYLHNKTAEIVKAGVNVVLDWGFWTKKERYETSEFYKAENIEFEWHYIDINDSKWGENIRKRNMAVMTKNTDDYYVDEGLLKKLNERFELPSPGEVDIWHKI